MKNKFENIDPKLVELSQKLEAKLTKDRPSYPDALRTFEERRLDWVKEDIFRAIIIQPTFERKGVNQRKWNFINFAWKDDGKSMHRPQKIIHLVKENKFEVIENNIDELLRQSEETLLNITEGDLS